MKRPSARTGGDGSQPEVHGPPGVEAAGRLNPGRTRPVVAGVLAAFLLAALIAGVVGGLMWSVVHLLVKLAAE